VASRLIDKGLSKKWTYLRLISAVIGASLVQLLEEGEVERGMDVIAIMIVPVFSKASKDARR
jgi:hypothetical protein